MWLILKYNFELKKQEDILHGMIQFISLETKLSKNVIIETYIGGKTSE